MKTFKELLNEIYKSKNPDGVSAIRGAGQNVNKSGWHPDMENPERPMGGKLPQVFMHPTENNHKIIVDYENNEWQHIDTKKGGNGHVASGRDLNSLKRHLTNWQKIRKS